MPKVLLAEDDPMMVSLLKTLLKLEGYEVDTLLDKPGNYLQTILNIKPDAILVDVYLGETNGVELVREMRRQPDLESMKIIMASGSPREEECMAAGANAFLLKPYMPDDLIKTLRA
jgi:DNA-binding response OmpR family regulator